MNPRERRTCRRFTLNYPVLMGTDRDRGHLAEILDAGVEGMRVRMTNQSGFQVGHEVNIACLSQQRPSNALKFRCRVVWEDVENLEVGLTYLQ